MGRGKKNNSHGGRGGAGRGGFNDGGRGGGRGRGRGGRGRGQSGFRGGMGRGGYDPSSDGLDYVVQVWNDSPRSATPTTPQRGRGGRGNYGPQDNHSPRGGFKGRGRGLGVTLADAARSHEAGYVRRLGAKLGANAPLSRVLYEERPLLRPITFVRGTVTATLFLEEEELLQPVNEEAGDEEAAHVPTAERVAQLFGGARATPPPETGGSSEDDGEDGEEELEEIDFADVGRIQEVVDAAALAQKSIETSATTTTSVTEEVQEKFSGFYIDTKPTPVVVSSDDQPIPGDILGFSVDAMPAYKPSTPSAPGLTRHLSVVESLMDDSEEEIVYVAPHPRKGNIASQSVAPPIIDLPTVSILTGIEPVETSTIEPTKTPVIAASSDTVMESVQEDVPIKSEVEISTSATPVPSFSNPQRPPIGAYQDVLEASAAVTAAPELVSPEPALQPSVPEVAIPEVVIPPAPAFSSVSFNILGTGTLPRRLPPRQVKTQPKSLLKNRRVHTRGKGAKSAFAAAALRREEAELQAGREGQRRDPRWKERRKGDDDIDWGTESEENEAKDSEKIEEEEQLADADDMDAEEVDLKAMMSFVKSMGPEGSMHVTMDEIEDEEIIRTEDAEELGSSGDSSTDSEETSEEDDDNKEMEIVFEAEEAALVGDGQAEPVKSFSSSDDSDEDGSPRRAFQNKLEKARNHANKNRNKGKKGKGRTYVWSEDEDEDDFDDMFTWGDDTEQYIAHIQAIVDQNSDIIEGKDRKAKKKLFNAIRDGDLEDIMMQPAPRRKDKGKHIPPDLQVQWQKDREKKAERKRERELQKLIDASDPMAYKKGGKKGRKASLAAAALDSSVNLPNRVFDIHTLENQIRRFLADIGGARTMALPPLPKEERKKVHELAMAFNLKSESKGKGVGRYTTLIKTTKSGIGVNERKISKIVNTTQVYFLRDNKRGPKPVMPKHKEGDEVGKAAPRIDGSNIGFRMLSSMGWTEGSRIGVSGGLEAPITAIIKHTKLGLGATR